MVVLTLVIAWIARPRVIVGVICGGCGLIVVRINGSVMGNIVVACCRASLMVLDVCLYVSWNSFGVIIAIVSLFWICISVVMPYVYSLLRYFWDFILEVSVRLVYIGLDSHVCSSGVFLRGKARFAVVTCISYSLLSRKRVLAMGDLVHACCLSFGRCSEPSYLAVIYLVSPWYISLSCLGSLRACINCCPMQCM